MKLWHWLLGGATVAGILLAAGTAAAAPGPRATRDEDLFNDALRRLRNFIAAARIDAVARRQDTAAGMVLEVVPGARFVAEDAAALPRQIDGLDVVIKGWNR